MLVAEIRRFDASQTRVIKQVYARGTCRIARMMRKSTPLKVSWAMSCRKKTGA
jgi:hypothetical protein